MCHNHGRKNKKKWRFWNGGDVFMEEEKESMVKINQLEFLILFNRRVELRLKIW